ncbi:MAG: TIGR03936 family radical SAM-associated protein [Anaerolineae bacterium]|jgi:radical SAM-linked protein
MGEGLVARDETPVQRLRVQFSKGEQLAYISHLDLARTWERVCRRAGLPLAHSQGFNPRPRYQLAAALPVGVTGRSEFLDLWLVEAMEPEDLEARLRPCLPPGLEVLRVEETDLRGPALQAQTRAADYRAVVRNQEPAEAVSSRVRALLAAPLILRQRQHKGKQQTYDLRPLIQTVTVERGPAGEHVLNMRLQLSPEGAGRPDEVLEALGLTLDPHRIERTNLCFEFDK